MVQQDYTPRTASDVLAGAQQPTMPDLSSFSNAADAATTLRKLRLKYNHLWLHMPRLLGVPMPDPARTLLGTATDRTLAALRREDPYLELVNPVVDAALYFRSSCPADVTLADFRQVNPGRTRKSESLHISHVLQQQLTVEECIEFRQLFLQYTLALQRLRMQQDAATKAAKAAKGASADELVEEETPDMSLQTAEMEIVEQYVVTGIV